MHRPKDTARNTAICSAYNCVYTFERQTLLLCHEECVDYIFDSKLLI
jgi:hypothetical protein